MIEYRLPVSLEHLHRSESSLAECKNYPLDIEDGFPVLRNGQTPRVVEAAAPVAGRWLSALEVLGKMIEMLKRTHQSQTGAFEVDVGAGRSGNQD